MLEKVTSQENTNPGPNYILRRIGAAAALAVVMFGGYKVTEAVTHVDTYSSKTVIIPGADKEEGVLPIDVTRAAVCDATTDLVNDTEFPRGVTELDKRDMKKSCVDLADDADERNSGDATNKVVTVKVMKNFLSDYYVTSEG